MPKADINDILEKLANSVEYVDYLKEQLEEALQTNESYEKPLNNVERDNYERALTLLKRVERILLNHCQPTDGTFIAKGNLQGHIVKFLRSIEKPSAITPMGNRHYIYRLMLEAQKNYPRQEIDQVWLDAFNDDKT